MPLTDTAIRNIKAGVKSIKLFDERGLYLEVSPKGGKWWRLKYRFDNKEKRISLGVYPDISLKDARDRRDEARKLLANGVDPSENRKAIKSTRMDRAANSFEVVGREWFVKYSPTWVSNHGDRIIRRFERDIFPWIGGRPIAEITAPELLSVIRRIESRGALETAHRALSNCSQVFRYAVATGRAERDPSGDLRGALPPVKGTHFAATTEPKRVAEILRAMDGYEGTLTVRCALRLAPLVFVRPGELRNAEWANIDFETAEWRYLVTKTSTQHIVPLSRQAVEILLELQPLTGNSRFVFPSARSHHRPMSDNAILAAMRRLGIDKEEMSGHGFRAVARTILDEVLGVRPDFIEHQLAHAVRDPNGRAYNRTAHLPERRKMMQQWADYLDKLKVGAEIIPIHKNA
ncbi:integrase arm-type DNA-binding domain-containing protein [Nitrosomonas sp. sh817]|uniref:tyrosine-type recombinase/integrase n=1 Tax=Nitrosomonas sp. sh817 TaxID=3070658 RepID=UPI0027DBB57A|nr:integrase arm-type DNA-binding domain-containing protein [Nitrosomonas sp. sh817]WMJ07614.1 integrase arm-type DNA-binding domain-containing protein [Nitrosomonas sp. sh817]